MSGRQKLHLYLWRKFEQQSLDPKGLDLITKIDIIRRPIGGKIKQQSRLYQLTNEGIVVVPDTTDRKLPLELNIQRSRLCCLKAIKDVEVPSIVYPQYYLY
jgi:hypothetical protein